MLTLSLPLLLGMAAAAVLAVAPSVMNQVSADGAQDSFVQRSGTRLLLGGQPFRFAGLNIYNANSNGWCWYAMNAGSALDDALSNIGPGKAVIRAWFHQPLAMNANGERDWSAFDHTLAAARSHGVKVIVTLSDQWGECGDGGQGGAVPGANGFKPKSWYIDGYTQADPGLLAPYRDWVQEVVGRYQADATIFAWQLMNEAEIQEYWGAGCPPGDEPAQILKAWAADVSALVKSIDPDHLVSLGTIGSGQCGAQGDQYQFVHGVPTIDLCEYHDYTSNAPMPGDQWNGLQRRIAQCTGLNKPIFVGEVGIRPSDVGGTLEARATALDAKLQAQLDAGVSGVLSWAWSNLGSTLDNYDIGPGDAVLGVLSAYSDSDGDGCSDVREQGVDPAAGGGRSAKSFWDFFDVNGDRAVNLFGDILGVAGRFGANDAGGIALINRTTDPLSAAPPAPAYHPAYDRTHVGPEAWRTGPPDGTINVFDDILGVASQFGHHCSGPV